MVIGVGRPDNGVYNCGMAESNICLQVGVKILLENSEGKYLLLRRSQEKYPEVTSRWDIAGGRIDPGTSLLENLRREVLEETTLELIGSPTLIAAQDILRKPGFHVVRLTYIGKSEGDVRIDPKEHDMHRWLKREDLFELGEELDGYFRELLNANVV